MIQKFIPEYAPYTYFVAHVDKAKLAAQKSLQKLETLKKALLQQYFE